MLSCFATQVEDACTFVVQYNGDAFRKRIADQLGIKSVSQAPLPDKTFASYPDQIFATLHV